MRITIEQVEKLRERANVSYEEARAALEKADGDLLEAMILLEREGKTSGSAGYYSTSTALPARNNGGDCSGGTEPGGRTEENGYANRSDGGGGGESFGELMARFGRFIGRLFRKSMTNYFEVYNKNDGSSFKLPVLFLILALIICNVLTVILLVVGLFCGYFYRFSGPDLGREDINRVMDSASDTAENMKENARQNGGDNK